MAFVCAIVDLPSAFRESRRASNIRINSYKETLYIVTKILNLCKTCKHGLFIGICLVITSGIGYNIGRIQALHSLPAPGEQEANVFSSVEQSLDGTALPTAIPLDPRVVVSKASSSKVYHYSWCSGGKRIKESNRLWFPTEADAIAAGYTLAGNCQ
jgi:hypothetical protein